MGSKPVTVTHAGTQASRTALSADASAGATNIKIRNANGFAVGDKLILGASEEGDGHPHRRRRSRAGRRQSLDFTPALTQAHLSGEQVIQLQATGLDLAAPLRFNHAANLPFNDQGTGISFQPATAFAHSSNEPVQALGAGITLDSPLAREHAIDAVVRDTPRSTAGYQGTPAPDQWFGGPALSPSAGNMVLRDGAGLVVDSLNYGLLVDPWAAEGYQAASGLGASGCRVATPGSVGGFGPAGLTAATYKSAGRYPDGADADSNCNDFVTQAVATLGTASVAGTTNIKVANVEGFGAGQTIIIDTGAHQETAVIATVGTPGATTMDAPTGVGATTIPVANAFSFRPGQTITIDSGANTETAIVASGGRR